MTEENNALITEQQAVAELEKGYDNAKQVLEDKDKLEKLFQKIEKKVKSNSKNR